MVRSFFVSARWGRAKVIRTSQRVVSCVCRARVTHVSKFYAGTWSKHLIDVPLWIQGVTGCDIQRFFFLVVYESHTFSSVPRVQNLESILGRGGGTCKMNVNIVD